ncbi:hypothetical protein GSI_12268 [Ganoderma sinense ZZ0214-1]|uniref:Uncharacterized protein n=1 Tax=Ganoderma sinense ZZ0214-1 TaxID=1077348 RepID=A0A2G8RYB7_9APHY|nr:hypothetical protein GSI_12268 [Ganoderma sinense ZZ0214-1]
MPCIETLHIKYIRSEELEPLHSRHRVHAPRLTLLSVTGNRSSLTQLVTALDAPNLATASVRAISDDPRTHQFVDFVSWIETLATLGSPSTLEDLEIALYEPREPPVVEHLADLLAPLLVLPNVTRFSLSCSTVLLVGANDDFPAAARAWPKLRVFQLWRAYWAPRVDPDDESSELTPIPTPQVLACFRDQCPALEELMLPYLDFDADVPVPVPARRVPRDGSCHGLARLALGAKDVLREDDEDDDWEPDERDDRKATECARYILDLFPNLDVDSSHARCASMLATMRWREAFERIRPLSQQRD